MCSDFFSSNNNTSNKVIKRDRKKFSSSRRVTRDNKLWTLYKQWHRPINIKTVHKPFYSIPRATSIDSDCCRLLTGQRSQQQCRQITLQTVLINKPKFLKATSHTEIREVEILRYMVLEALS